MDKNTLINIFSLKKIYFFLLKNNFLESEILLIILKKINETLSEFSF